MEYNQSVETGQRRPVVTRSVHASFLLQQLSQTRTLVFHPCSGTGFRLSEHLLHTAEPQPRHWKDSSSLTLLKVKLQTENLRGAFGCQRHCELESFESCPIHCLTHGKRCRTGSCHRCYRTLADTSHNLVTRNPSPNSLAAQNP